MRLDTPDLRCDRCAAAIHPFVPACPACGTEAASLIGEARTDPDLGATALSHDQGLLDDVVSVANFYTFRSGGASSGTTLDEGLSIALRIVDYVVTIGATEIRKAAVTLEGDALTIRDQSGRGGVAPILLPGWSILGAAAGKGRITIYRAAADPIVLAERRGLAASRPRMQHWATLERWLAPWVAAAAERRWTAVGVDAHARELGLAPEDQATPETTAATPAAAAAPPDVAGSLRALDVLREQGLVSADEYAEKRREILARL